MALILGIMDPPAEEITGSASTLTRSGEWRL